ncbi:hypothetical protein EW146_g2890 [Bondarzewia mesenterica]|uniref:Cytochrome P450 n=1 Tax=Bondarzewia mesenterica TaxID=1095465 RepID=A0A4S4LZS9_9AGAM|nr:hypothetical protein EW146_g2890 [Bondarzewia mesenterica]
MTTPILQPPAIPFLGNITTIEREVPLRSFELLAKQYGEIYRLHILGRDVVVITSYRLVNEVSDEKRFHKTISSALREVRNLVGDGLFTLIDKAFPGEPNWAIARAPDRLLMPAFGAASIRGMFDDMVDIASQLLLKWERFGPNYVIEPAEDFTRLALDTICLTSMSYRMRANRPSIIQAMMSGVNAKYQEDVKIMTELADEIVAERKANPIDKNDLLNKMLHGRDPKTGEGLSDRAITNNLLTFLIAGHETTSGTLTFMIYYLLKNPECIRKLREEVDEVVGDQQVQLGDLSKLPYLVAVMRETLRLSPPAPMRVMTPNEATTLAGGAYAVNAGVNIVIHSGWAQKDPIVWGDDADEFKPERNLDGKFEALPPNAWQPFGFGVRACIGRAFAWQEILISMACIIQRFDLVMVDPSYNLQLKQALTIKPDGFFIRATPRAGRHILVAPRSSSLLSAPAFKHNSALLSGDSVPKKPLYVLYGSNTGTAEAFAQRIASEASAHGFRSTLGTLDSATEHIPTDGPIVVVTASFEGEPADNATHFVEWLSNLKSIELANVKYGVFGCGNHDWVQTYQRIPTLLDELFEKRGGQRLIERGVGDVGSGNFFECFDEWEAQMWQVLTKAYHTTESKSSSALQVKTVDAGTARATALRQPDAVLGAVVENRLLTAPGAPAKHHIEFKLPEGATYRTGDYLAILPTNPIRDVRRAIAHFGLSAEQEVVITSVGPTPLPVDKPISILSLLSGYVELAQPATTRDLRVLIEEANSESTVAALKQLSSSYQKEILEKRLSLMDILEAYADIKLPFETFLHILPSMRIRQYSISSSPLWNANHVTLTISVLNALPMSGRVEPFLGVASTYLADLKPGDRVQMSVRASAAAFRPPADPTIPLVMFCAGSGLAPMRGFIQERAAQKQSGRDVGPILLFFGCRSPRDDFLYSDSDLANWMEFGVVDVRPAFSRSTEDSLGCKYIQDRIWHDRVDISNAFQKEAKFFSCGAGKMAAGVKEQLIEIIKESPGERTAEQAAEAFERISKGRLPATYVYFIHEWSVVFELQFDKSSFGPDYVFEPATDFIRLTLETIGLASMSYRTNAKYQEDIKFMVDVADEIVAERKAHSTDRQDLLNKMLNDKDPKTGQGMSDKSITNNLITFLIAGHETTSGTLSFITYHLLKYPECMRKLSEEVDNITGDRDIVIIMSREINIVAAVVPEALRLSPAATMRSATPFDNTTLASGIDFTVGGERVLNGKFEALPPNAGQPFSHGIRGCIGRTFAWQEILLVMAALVQKFDLTMDGPSYDLRLNQALAVKPAGFTIRAITRKSCRALRAPPSSALLFQHGRRDGAPPVVPNLQGSKPLYVVLYGSNTGSSEAFAQWVASEALSYGFHFYDRNPDSVVEHIPNDGPVIVQLLLYLAGEPADNAAHFVEWLSNLKANELATVRFGVFGCGNHTGETNMDHGVSSNGEYQTQESKVASSLEVKVVDAGAARASALKWAFDCTWNSRQTSHSLPINPSRDIHRVIARFDLSAGQEVIHECLQSSYPVFICDEYYRLDGHFVLGSNIPTCGQISIQNLLSEYIELSQPTTTRILGILIDATESAATIAALKELSSDFQTKVLEKRVSVLDILEAHPDIKISFATFLQIMPLMRARQYSISSSPLWNPKHVTLTISVIRAPSISGRVEPFLGIASTYLTDLKPEDRVQMRACVGCSITPSNGPFGAYGHEKAAQKQPGRDVGPTPLFFGCRTPRDDYLYSDSYLSAWVYLGVVDIRPAFSRSAADSLARKYIQDRMWHDRADISNAYAKDAKASSQCTRLQLSHCSPLTYNFSSAARARLLEPSDPNKAMAVLEESLEESDLSSIDTLLEKLQIPAEYARSEAFGEPEIFSRLDKWKENAFSSLYALRSQLQERNALTVEEQAEVAFAAAAFAGEGDWSSEQMRDISGEILESFGTPDIPLLERILNYHIKSLFRSNPHPSLNPNTGRKLPRNAGGPMAAQDAYEGQVWKENAGVANVLQWCVRHIHVRFKGTRGMPHLLLESMSTNLVDMSQTDMYASLWYLIVPPTMTLLDDYEAKYKIQGIRVIELLLVDAPPDLLCRTGITDLLFASLHRALTFLHSPQTPALLHAAIRVALCAILGDGIIGSVWMYGYHDQDIIEASVQVLPILRFNVITNWIMKALIPQLSHPLHPNPDKPPQKALQMTSLRALLCVMQACSPRIYRWKGTILDAVANCWVTLADSAEEGSGMKKNVLEMRTTLREVCVELIKSAPSVVKEYKRLITLDVQMFDGLVGGLGEL